MFMNTAKKIVVFGFGLFVIGGAPLAAMADETTSVKKINESELRINKDSSVKNKDLGFEEIENGILPSPSIKDANDWAERKGKDVSAIGQTFTKWIAVAAFFGGLIATIFGAFSGHAGRGIVVMAIAVAVYAGAMYGTEILSYFSSWLGT